MFFVSYWWYENLYFSLALDLFNIYIWFLNNVKIFDLKYFYNVTLFFAGVCLSKCRKMRLPMMNIKCLYHNQENKLSIFKTTNMMSWSESRRLRIRMSPVNIFTLHYSPDWWSSIESDIFCHLNTMKFFDNK